MAEHEITARHKVESPAEHEVTKPGPVFSPAVDIYESEQELTLLADMPGVEPDAVDIDLKDGVLTISAEVGEEVNESEHERVTEFEYGRYFRRFTLSDLIDQAKIEANMKSGVLELHLPKVDKAQPRKINIALN